MGMSFEDIIIDEIARMMAECNRAKAQGMAGRVSLVKAKMNGYKAGLNTLLKKEFVDELFLSAEKAMEAEMI